MKVGHFGPTFIFPGKTVNFFGVKFFVTSFLLKVRKSQKKSACLDAYLHVYKRKRDRGVKFVEKMSNDAIGEENQMMVYLSASRGSSDS